eukprot:CAMPEP_0178574910 /NCGR_PEP_ID=MMETSP0697-20121206/19616_1 /TAXON_ID=265572 /ORGANISM="Extubocellulus spinifer, Strain CCMP396" /LENGTH=103 /DNA_ID=CAMNT_0020209953 /DNA_START=27 /DNA_END=339 /DNA_ORIENTATION=-
MPVTSAAATDHTTTSDRTTATRVFSLVSPADSAEHLGFGCTHSDLEVSTPEPNFNDGDLNPDNYARANTTPKHTNMELDDDDHVSLDLEDDDDEEGGSLSRDS